MRFDDKYSIKRSELYPPPDCREHSKTIKLKNVNNQDVIFTERFETFISIGNLSKTEDGKLKFKFLDRRYENCKGLNPKLNLKCEDDDGKETIQTIAGLEIESGNITGLRCKAMGYLSSPTVQETFPYRQWSECFSSSGTGCDYTNDEDSAKRDKIIVVVVGVSVGDSLLLLSMVGVVSGLLIYRRKEVEVHVHTITTSVSPSHIVFNKSDNIRDEIDMAGTMQVRKTDNLKYENNVIFVPGRS